MKRRRTYLDLLAQRALAIAFACLFIFQAGGLFHGTAVLASPSQTSMLAETVDRIAVASEHCNRLTHDGAPANGQCDHAGFCPFCSASDRDAKLLDAPPAASVIGILAPEDETPGRFARSVERATPLPSSSGLDESRFATAPPRA